MKTLRFNTIKEAKNFARSLRRNHGDAKQRGNDVETTCSHNEIRKTELRTKTMPVMQF